ncbi:gp284 [Sphingomonas phage PAU]|uniref:gp284 n=1 Tax=Sphingomonas phage PAU TaxID=1150991 RepID=UPI000257349B|nr:gp284 [Sphingomonas phage PAU]AFF28282.1 gp284 [Sphingomonas phage PAU]
MKTIKALLTQPISLLINCKRVLDRNIVLVYETNYELYQPEDCVVMKPGTVVDVCTSSNDIIFDGHRFDNNYKWLFVENTEENLRLINDAQMLSTAIKSLEKQRKSVMSKFEPLNKS